jgi:hypothetical protein
VYIFSKDIVTHTTLSPLILQTPGPHYPIARGARAIALYTGELSYSEDNGVLGDSDPNLSISDDGSLTDDEQGRSSTTKHSAQLPLHK